MASKKKKPISSEFNTVDVEAETSKIVKAETMSESDKIQAKAGTIDLSISEEIQQKLDSIDKLADENAKYAEEIINLQERLAGYIQEIADLKSQKHEHTDSFAETARLNAEIDRLKSENEKLKAALDAANKQNRPFIRDTALQTGPASSPRLTANCYRRRIIGEYPSWN